MTETLAFFEKKKVLITGHTGFKGSWLTALLVKAGAQVVGYALEPPTEPSMFQMLPLEKHIDSMYGDMRDLKTLTDVFDRFQPEIVFHLAAQPIVRTSYSEPVYTYAVNVMGTVNLMECVRTHPSVRSVVNVTTDKVYHNNEWEYGYREIDPLDGFDPYSNSKSCSESVTHSYVNSFLNATKTAVSTARAGNVIGGGDFAPDRIIPDCFRAAEAHQPIFLRNPHSTRPYQHVLEPLCAYLEIARHQYLDFSVAGSYNIGPNYADCLTTAALVELFVRYWRQPLKWEVSAAPAPHEAAFLKLDCSKIKQRLGWKPTWNIEQAIEKTVEWYEAYAAGEDMWALTNRQIDQYF